MPDTFARIPTRSRLDNPLDFMLVYANMKKEKSNTSSKRPYRMGVRAEAAEETRLRILDAVIGLHMERYYDQISLEDVAKRAGVTVQTVLRRFGSKDRLSDAATEMVRERVMSQRGEVPVGDIAGAVENLVDHYEEWGDSVVRLLVQEDRVPAFRRATDAGRLLHYEWVERAFASLLAEREGEDRGRLRAELVAVCDVYFWKILRRDLGLSRAQTALALEETIVALKGEKR
jgi:AcrR family transcriptional regulator